MRRLLVPVLAATLSLVGLGAPAANAATFTSAPIPRLVGTAVQWRFITIEPGTWSPTPTSMIYRFYKTCGTTTTKVQAGSSRVYHFKTTDVGCTFRGQVVASRTGYTTTSRTSRATAPVALPTVMINVNNITGTVSVGSTLTVPVAGIGFPSDTTVTCRWYKQGPDRAEYLVGTGRTHTVTAAEYGFRYLVKATGTRQGYLPATRQTATTAWNLSPLQKTMAAQYGVDTDYVLSGVGSTTTLIPEWARHGMLIASHPGDGVFSVEVLDENFETIDWPVYVDGAYTGTTAYMVDPLDDGAADLRIEAEGAWTIRMRSFAFAPVLGSTAAGTGDRVFIYGMAAGTWNIASDSDFFWMAVGNPVSDLWAQLFDEAAPFSGSAHHPAGPIVVGVEANGPWKLTSS